MASLRRAQSWVTTALGGLWTSSMSPVFIASLPRQSRRLLYAAGFFMFFALGFISDLTQSSVVSPVRVVAVAMFSGVAAIVYTFALAHYRRWFPAVVVGHLALMFLSPIFDRSTAVPLAAAPLDAVRAKLAIGAMGCLLGFLASYIAFMRFIGAEGKRYARAYAEIELAREIHQTLVPTIDWSDGRYEIHGMSRPSTEVGGDLVDVAQAPAGWIGYVADVSGHGVGAGLLMGILKSAMRTRVASADDIGDLLTHVNQVLVPLSKPNMYATLALLHDRGGAQLTFSVAGHPPILHYRAATATIAEVSVPQIPLGIFPDRAFTSATVDATPGDLFAIVTDGLTEVFNAADDEFGMDRLKAVLTAHAAAPLAVITDAVLRATRAFGPQADDQTLLLVRVRERPAATKA